MKVPGTILPIIVFSQFCCTSLWFAGNGVMTDLVLHFNIQEQAVGHLTSAVQFGFITGTLVFALLTISDRFSPSNVFFVCAIAGALVNAGIILDFNTLTSLFTFRFFTGFFLAGIYPVGMKIAADYYQKGLGSSLGLLVGALVLGTAFPHLLKNFTGNFSWKWVIVLTSLLALTGGFLIFTLVPDGPFHKKSMKPDLKASYKVFRNKKLRTAAFGYFGHMWELYAFWAFVPFIINIFFKDHPNKSLEVSLLSFLVIGLGGVACMAGGYISRLLGEKNTAFMALLLSGLCCLISPFVFSLASLSIFMIFLIFWGLVVAADSPLFSTMVAQNALAESKGTALTIVTSIGFAITIVSIQLLNYIRTFIDPHFLFMVLAVGPIFGIWAWYKDKNQDSLR